MKMLLTLSWLLGLAFLFILQYHFKGESTAFLGITDDSGQTISFEYPVKIVEISVVAGEQVQEGAVLLKVRRSNLEVKQAVLDEKIHELDSRKQTSIASIKSEIKSLQAQKSAKKADIDVQIKKLQAKYQVNKKLLADITGSRGSSKSNNPILEQIGILKQQRTHIGSSLQAQISNLQTQLNQAKKPIYAQMGVLKERRSELDRQVADLVVKAQINGRVGNVLRQVGDVINSFQPIFSIHASHPEFVKGYIHENVYNQIQSGQQVWVSSLALNSNGVTTQTGTVVSISNRIVEYPSRLKKNVLVSAWGREILVRLSGKNNNLLLGEKVSISVEKPKVSAVKRLSSWMSSKDFKKPSGDIAYVSD